MQISKKEVPHFLPNLTTTTSLEELSRRFNEHMIKVFEAGVQYGLKAAAVITVDEFFPIEWID